jgi:hypothetical protein
MDFNDNMSQSSNTAETKSAATPALGRIDKDIERGYLIE